MNLIGLVERIYYAFHFRGDVVERLSSRFPRDASLRVLDLGGGEGRISRALAASSPSTFVVADIDADALGRVPGGGPLHPVLVPGSGRLPFRRGAFDRVLLIDVLHEVGEGRAALLEELVCALGPGGEMLVVDFDGRSRVPRILGTIARLAGRRCLFFEGPEAMRLALERAGLEGRVEALDGLRLFAKVTAPAGARRPLAGAAAGTLVAWTPR